MKTCAICGKLATTEPACSGCGEASFIVSAVHDRAPAPKPEPPKVTRGGRK